MLPFPWTVLRCTRPWRQQSSAATTQARRPTVSTSGVWRWRQEGPHRSGSPRPVVRLELAKDWLQTHSTTTSSKTDKKDKPPPHKCPKCGQPGHWARYCPNPRMKQEEPTLRKDTRPNYLDGVKCYSCNQKGHLAANCPSRSLYCDLVVAAALPRGQEHVHCRGTLNRIVCSDILVDTGATNRETWCQMMTFWMARSLSVVPMVTLSLTPSQLLRLT